MNSLLFIDLFTKRELKFHLTTNHWKQKQFLYIFYSPEKVHFFLKNIQKQIPGDLYIRVKTNSAREHSEQHME